jgi:cysteinyl-tRNA synthetase
MLKVFNSLSRKKEAFKPIAPPEVYMYVCGPTVYGPGHIGHARTYIAFDIIRRYLEYKGYSVVYVVNITDIHDDMIKKAGEEGITIFELAEKNIPLFFRDIKELGIKDATCYPRVTETIPEIIEMVKTLEEKGFAYETEDGVYYSIDKFEDYGKLSRLKLEERKGGTRVETDKYDKTNPMDFALWKKSKTENEPAWDSPWGRGRPGWHIECSAMSKKILGEQIDVHGGAVDLMFPHHENEIAQSEATTGKKPFVKYWLHTGFLNVNGEKMSKSLGNFITLPELLKETDSRVFRFFISGIHYRSPVDYTQNAVVQAKETLEKQDNLIHNLLGVVSNSTEKPQTTKMIEETRKKFAEAMDDDFNFPKAWAVLFGFAKKINSLLAQNTLCKKDAQKIISFLKEINYVFNVFTFETKKEENLSNEIMQMIEKREELRKQKKFTEADNIRKQLSEKGIELIDTPNGVKWKKNTKPKKTFF